MDLGCPLLRGSSVRRLRRCAATLPLLLESTFPGSTFFSAFVEVMAAVRDLGEGNIFFWVRRLSGMCRGSVRRLPAVEGTDIEGVDIEDGTDGSGDSGL